MSRSIAPPQLPWPAPASARAAVVAEAPAPASPRAGTPLLAGTRGGWPMRAVYMASDAASIFLAFAAGELARGWWQARGLTPAEPAWWRLELLLAAGLLVSAALARTYAAIPPRPVRQFRAWVTGAALSWLAVVLAAMCLGTISLLEQVQLALVTVLAVLGASFSRALCRSIFGKQPWWGTRLIVVGNCQLADKALRDLLGEPQWGLRPVGFVSDDSAAPQGASETHFLGRIDELDDLAFEFQVDRGLAVAHSFDLEQLAELVARPVSRIRHWIILPPLTHFPSLWMEDCEAARLPALALSNRLAAPAARALKRVADMVFTVAIGLAVLPLIAAVALMVRLSSPGPVLYASERVGRGGRRFWAWKFRTMYQDADALLDKYLAEHPELAAEWHANTKLRHDPRVTWIGHWLRVTSLDELPQIWNVLRGDMSLVGPRPILPSELEKYAEGLEHYRVVLPGLTGLWQVSGRNNTTYQERIALDTYYVKNWSPWLDVYILACTVKVVLLGEGAY